MKQQLRKAMKYMTSNRRTPEQVRRRGIRHHWLATRPLLTLGFLTMIFTFVVYGPSWTLIYGVAFIIFYFAFSEIVWQHFVSDPYRAALDAAAHRDRHQAADHD